jgi:hypothetical protein
VLIESSKEHSIFFLISVRLTVCSSLLPPLQSVQSPMHLYSIEVLVSWTAKVLVLVEVQLVVLFHRITTVVEARSAPFPPFPPYLQ